MDQISNNTNLAAALAMMMGKVDPSEKKETNGARGLEKSQDKSQDETMFQNELTQAQAFMSQINAVQMPKAQAQSQVQVQSQAQAQSQVQAQAQAGVMASTEQKQLGEAAKSVTGLNTANTLAGLRPGSIRDWVFQNSPESSEINPEVKPLFDIKLPGASSGVEKKAGVNPDAELAALKQILAEAKSTLAQAQARHPGQASAAAESEPLAQTQRPQAHAQNLGMSDAQLAFLQQPLSPELSGTQDLQSDSRGEVELSPREWMEAQAALAKEPEKMRHSHFSHPGLDAGAAVTGQFKGAHQLEQSVPQLPRASANMANISGGEFLNTLNSARFQAQHHGMQSNLGQEQGGEREAGTQAGDRPNLRLIDGMKGKKLDFADELASSQAGAMSHPLAQSLAEPMVAAPSVEVTGHVTKGAMSQDRLSSESIMALGGAVQNLGPQGTGEIRMRLKPDNLGEIHLRVRTDGNQVGLQIQASDEKAKKILEESLTHLKDSLANQSLTLGKVDLTVASSHGSSNEHQNSGQQPGSHAQFQDMVGQNSNQGSHNRRDSWPQVDHAHSASATRARQAMNATPRATARREARDGRLDVTA